jgi:hypothetical protein
MKIKLRILQLFTMLALSVCFNAYADSWNCSNSDLVREVVVQYPEGGALPCNVIYKKQTEGFEDQVLWSAETEEGYCEEKARGLVDKLESWGWVCLETVSSEMEEVVEVDEAVEVVETNEGAEVDEVIEVDVETEPAADTEQ